MGGHNKMILVEPSAPIQLPDSLAPEFVENRLPGVHPKFGPLEPVYDGRNRMFARKESLPIIPVLDNAGMSDQSNKFMAAVREYERKVGTKNGVTWSTSQISSWEDVLQNMQLANQRYREVNKDGIMGNFRQCLRNFQKFSKPVNAWLKLLPEAGWQGSLVCGGIKIILGAAVRLEEVRDDIGRALESIPYTVDKVETLLHIYNDETIREAHVSQLFIVVLEVLQQCLIWFTKNPVKKALGAIFLQDEYGKVLQDKLGKLKSLEGRIDGQAMVGLHVGFKALSVTAENVDRKMDRGLEVMDKGLEVVQRMHSMLLDREELQTTIKKYELEMKAQREIIESERRAKLEAIGAERQASLLEAINFDGLGPRTDLVVSLGIGPSFYLGVQERAAWILGAAEVTNWLSSKHSQILIVNANEASHDCDSSVSLFSAMLVHALQNAERPIILHWFAGQNINATLFDMTFALLGQLLENRTVMLPVPHVGGRKGLDIDDFEDVVTMFGRCLEAQLKETSVYCICDSVSFYEDRKREADLATLFARLGRVVDQSEGRHQLKVLATSPMQCTYLGTHQDNTEPRVLTVPDIVTGAVQALNESSLIRSRSGEIMLYGA